jgi:hypothetical protein
LSINEEDGEEQQQEQQQEEGEAQEENYYQPIFAESLIDYHEKSGLELMKLSVMLEMLESYLDKGK